MLTSLALIIILSAVVVGVGRALTPYADELRPWLSERLSERFDQPVSVERLEANWPRLTPRLTLHGLRVGPADAPLLDVEKTRLELRLPDLLSARRNPFQLIVLGLDLVLAEDEAGRWGVELAGGGQVVDRSSRGALPAGDLKIRDATLAVRPWRGPPFTARLVDGDLVRRGDQTQIAGRLESVGHSGPGVRAAVLIEHPGGRLKSGRAWVEAEALQPEQWLEGVPLPAGSEISLEAWLSWSDAQGARLDLDLGLDRPGFEPVRTEWLLSRLDRRIQVELVGMEQGGSEKGQVAAVEGLAVVRSGERWGLAVDALDLERVHELAKPWLQNHEWWPRVLRGRLRDVRVGWEQARGLFALAGQLRGLEAVLPDRFPSVETLDLDFGLDGDRAVLDLGGKPQVDWPDLLRTDVRFDEVGGRVIVSRQAIELRGVRVANDQLGGRADGWIYLHPGQRPFIDLSIDAERVENVDPRPYLPPRYVPPDALAWLDQGLSRVGRARGEVVLHMRAGKKAREIKPGDFQAHVEVAGVDLIPSPGWPEAENLEGSVAFVGSGIMAEIRRGQFGPLALSAPRLEIGDLFEPELVLELESRDDDAGAVTDLLRALPGPVWKRVLAPMRWSGPAEVRTRLQLPLQSIEEWWMEGEVELSGASVSLLPLGIEFSELSGTARFDRQALAPTQLEARSGSEDLTLKLAAGFQSPGWLTAESTLNPAQLVDPDNPLAGLAGRMRGGSAVAFDLRAGDRDELVLNLRSDLVGLGLDLPAPLNKPRSEAWPLALEARLGAEGVTGRLDLGSRLAARWGSGRDGWRLGVGLDGGDSTLPDTAGLRVRGSIGRLELSDWLSLLARPMSRIDQPPAHADVALSLGELAAFGLLVSNLGVVAERTDQAWRLALASEALDGAITVPVPLDSGRVVVADLLRLHLDPVEPEASSPELATRPLTDQTSSQSPRGLPPLHLLVEDLRWGNLNLGRARVESHAVPDGTQFELIDVSGPDMRLFGRARWIEQDGRIDSEFNGRITTGNLGGLLESAGYEASVEAQHAQIDAQLRWPGAPVDFALSRLSGSFGLGAADGSIPEARPGAGRLLGLASFSAIPRRLMLDFRDVFSSGFKFDEIEGHFDLAAGLARTSGLVIRSPAARITILGDTDMVARRYDQTVVVEPGLGATLPLIGGLAGGPVGAAAGLVLQSILDRPLRGISEVRYAVTGSWDDPELTLVEARVTDEEGDEAVVTPPSD
jgi:uncharacterized protein (TIGR02099 family)